MISHRLRILLFSVLFSSLASAQQPFTHPGCLSTQADLNRMKEKVVAGQQPWKGSWDKLVKNTDNFVDDGSSVQSQIKAGGGGGENYIRLARDCAKTYQLALRYHGSGEKKFADKAVEILNSWADQHKGWAGDSNIGLRAGIYGYEFACAAELLRDYPGWQRPDFQDFQRYMLEQFYPINKDFLIRRNGTVPSHYWANWVHAAQASMMAIGVLCDDRKIFDEAVNYFYNGPGNENIRNAVPFVHPNGLGQWQESGRDQGHSLMGPILLGTICEIAWNQELDLYGAMDNRFLAGVEYISKYNLAHEVPWTTYVYVFGHPGKEKYWVQKTISSHARGINRPGWDLIYNHYVNRRGMSAPWTALYAEKNRPEGGGFDYGSSSGGFDGLGYTTLTHSRDPIGKGAVPSALRPFVEGRQITLSWAGSAGAESYHVKRATTKGGPYTTIANLLPPTQHYVDPNLGSETTYYYVVSAKHADGETADSKEAAATTDTRLLGTVIGTDGSYRDSGAEKFTVFDGSLKNYFDPPHKNAWVGLDFGNGVKARITAIKYGPRPGLGFRMVGGKFQGSNTPDFTEGVIDLYTVTKAPEDGILTMQSVTESSAFRYVRYLAPPDGLCDVAEIEFHGKADNETAP
ncbi:MAG: alginate lyase family protein [Verrucomicrobiota bacterium]